MLCWGLLQNQYNIYIFHHLNLSSICLGSQRPNENHYSSTGIEVSMWKTGRQKQGKRRIYCVRFTVSALQCLSSQVLGFLQPPVKYLCCHGVHLSILTVSTAMHKSGSHSMITFFNRCSIFPLTRTTSQATHTHMHISSQCYCPDSSKRVTIIIIYFPESCTKLWSTVVCYSCSFRAEFCRSISDNSNGLFVH